MTDHATAGQPSPAAWAAAEKVQLTSWQEPGLYGGFIHPWSSRNAGRPSLSRV
ncbi:hypothetical protein [Micromonospora foliorum]|uniref:hypothetical protein n=1 Tax=Micromonospora foliorum TaxID=2911210 RepID=UPI002379B2C7|nr:hypothetical protein [Micromonospora foliorum]